MKITMTFQHTIFYLLVCSITNTQGLVFNTNANNENRPSTTTTKRTPHTTTSPLDSKSTCFSSNTHTSSSNRRIFLNSSTAAATAATTAAAFILFHNPSNANARYILNEETGEYDEVEDENWQTTWKQRLDQANTMSKDEIFNAARGAGNLDLKMKNGGEEQQEESDASKKRRAMSACRDSSLRSKAGSPDARECNNRVIGGDFDFILSQL